jgi:hypothetical protein
VPMVGRKETPVSMIASHSPFLISIIILYVCIFDVMMNVCVYGQVFLYLNSY